MHPVHVAVRRPCRLRRAVLDVFGKRALVQRCQVHKRRNVVALGRWMRSPAVYAAAAVLVVAESIVLLNIGWNEPECDAQDGLCKLAKMFPYHYLGYVETDDYGPAFDEAASLVETACAGFVVPG